jgi:hypothetical protein
MELSTFEAHDVGDTNPAYRQRISDKRAMAAPGYRFGAYRTSLLFGHLINR